MKIHRLDVQVLKYCTGIKKVCCFSRMMSVFSIQQILMHFTVICNLTTFCFRFSCYQPSLPLIYFNRLFAHEIFKRVKANQGKYYPTSQRLSISVLLYSKIKLISRFVKQVITR